VFARAAPKPHILAQGAVAALWLDASGRPWEEGGGGADIGSEDCLEEINIWFAMLVRVSTVHPQNTQK